MKLNATQVGLFVLAASLTVGTVSCKKQGCTDELATNYDAKAKKDDGSCAYPEEETAVEVVTKAGFISSNETWTADKIYKLVGKVVVNDGVTLTIEPGTIIKGDEGTGTLASALIVMRGAKLNAVGSTDKPIIFTSVLDNITVGETQGTNMDETVNGKWGGLIILGKAPVSAGAGDTEAQIEGIPATDAFGTYGGNVTNDNSGSLSYISIRHGGASIGAGNEINGLTLGGVGSGTTINHIEVLSNQDDGIEFFGGSVNVSHVVIGYVGDDAIDIDQSYSGTITNFITISNTNSDKGLEIDGPEGVSNTGGLFALVNGTVKSKDGAGRNSDFKDKAQGSLNNVKFEGYSNNNLKVRASYQNDCADQKSDALTRLVNDGTLSFTTTQFGGVEVYTGSKANDGVTSCSVQAADQTNATSSAVSATATGCSTADMTWSWVFKNGKN